MLPVLALTLFMTLAGDAKELIAVRHTNRQTDAVRSRMARSVTLKSHAFSLIDDDDDKGRDDDGNVEYYENSLVELAAVESAVDWNIRYLNISSSDDATAGNDDDDDGDDQVLIYVVDTGTRRDHEVFQRANRSSSRVLAGHTARHLPQTKGWEDCNGHGTHVSSIAAGNRPHGIANQALVVPVAIFGCNGQGSLMDLIEGVNWIVRDMASRTPRPTRAIVNLSLQTQHSTIMDMLMEELWQAGALIVVAAGNSRGGGGDACDFSPASSNHVIAVGALAKDLTSIVSSTNTGPCVDLYVPGQHILGAWPLTPQHYLTMSGTSQATPHVTGLAALIWHRHPLLTRDRLHFFLLNKAIRPISIRNLDSVNTSTYISVQEGGNASVNIRLTPRRWHLLDAQRQCIVVTNTARPMTLLLATRHHQSNFVVRASLAYKRDGRYVMRFNHRRLARRPPTRSKRVRIMLGGRRAELSVNPDDGDELVLSLPYTTVYISLTRSTQSLSLICE